MIYYCGDDSHFITINLVFQKLLITYHTMCETKLTNHLPHLTYNFDQNGY